MSHHLTATSLSSEMQECIHNCSDCHDVCLAQVLHCLEMGGEHAAPAHIRLLLDCADACGTSRDFMLRSSEFHSRTCGICADICEKCADECERLADGDEQMLKCAEICRVCADSCRRMS